MKKTIVSTNRLMILAVMKMKRITCTSPQHITMLQLCTILHQLRITQTQL